MKTIIQPTEAPSASSAELIPQGQTREEIQQRRKFIKDFYANWNAVNSTKHIFNVALNDFIHVRFLSIQETAEQAAYSYKSTLAITYLTEILEKATVEKRVKPKVNNQNQKRFSEIIIMQYHKQTFGKIKLTVGVLRGSKQNIQYCITAIEKTTNNPPHPGNNC
ncbi:MAG: hypothetical protein LBH22_09425 [Bacteroidales bacterium]|jgi:ATP-dependent Lon protease|nr:hypothetical protein [Bacteroidales bacterium]